MSTIGLPPPAVVERSELGRLLELLQEGGRALLGPTVREGAIVYERVRAEADLPIGWTDEQEAGRYRLRRRDDAAVFGYAVGPQAWKKVLFPPEVRLWRAQRDREAGFRLEAEPPAAGPHALLGVRSCELHAIAIQDRVFLQGEHPDAVYAARREDLLLVAVNCAVAGGTCFCVSMNTGPKVTLPHDLALTELLDPAGHRFLIEVGSPAGAGLLARLPHRAAGAEDLAAAGRVVERTAASMGRTLDTRGIRELLQENPEHPRWDEVAQRCLSCANCTLVCPTCFCHSVEDTSDLTGENAERWRRWDSCFSLDFSYLHGGAVRQSTRSRYRQWMTHKLSTWWDQFGTSGCVGCGRCITWCPVGIDITAEAAAIREGS